MAAAGAALEPFGDRVRIVHGGFEDVAEIVGREQRRRARGTSWAILFDLGVSSPQLDRPVRGFSYWADAAPLDMRMDSAQELTAAMVVNEYAEADLAASSRATVRSASRATSPPRSWLLARSTRPAISSTR